MVFWVTITDAFSLETKKSNKKININKQTNKIYKKVTILRYFSESLKCQKIEDGVFIVNFWGFSRRNLRRQEIFCQYLCDFQTLARFLPNFYNWPFLKIWRNFAHYLKFGAILPVFSKFGAILPIFQNLARFCPFFNLARFCPFF